MDESSIQVSAIYLDASVCSSFTVNGTQLLFSTHSASVKISVSNGLSSSSLYVVNRNNAHQ